MPILPHFVDLITRGMFVEQIISLSSPLCSLIQSPVTSHFLGPYISCVVETVSFLVCVQLTILSKLLFE